MRLARCRECGHLGKTHFRGVRCKQLRWVVGERWNKPKLPRCDGYLRELTLEERDAFWHWHAEEYGYKRKQKIHSERLDETARILEELKKP